MPRCKALTRRINDEQSSHLSWNLGELGDLPRDHAFANTQTLSINNNNNNEEDEYYTPPKKRIRRSRDKYSEILNAELLQLISEHDFYVSIGRRKLIDKQNIACVFGSVELTLKTQTAPYEFPDFNSEFWLYVNSEDAEKSLLYFEEENKMDDSLSINYNLVESLPPLELLSALRVKKNFYLTFKCYDAWQRKVVIDVVLRNGGMTILQFPSEAPRMKPNLSMQIAVQSLHNIYPPDYSGKRRTRRHNIDALYAAVKERQFSYALNFNVQHESLLPKLRQYQEEAVRWMIKKERACENSNGLVELHQLYQPLEMDGKIFYYNRFGGYLVNKKPTKAVAKPGGILADEMGLGKTVEVLACVLCNRREDSNVEEEEEEPDHSYSHPPSEAFFQPVRKDDALQLFQNNPDRNKFSIDDDNSSISSALQDSNWQGWKMDLQSNSLQSVSTDMELAEDATEASDSFAEAGPSSASPRFRKINTASTLSDGPRMSDGDNVNNKASFECICGADLKLQRLKDQVQCTKCGVWQHKPCVRYDNSMGPYFCPHCWVAKPPIPSRATLIVCPQSIYNQWLDEIQQHIQPGVLKLYEYNGVYKTGFVQPPVLCDNDLVVTTYEILRKELDYVDLPHSNSDAGRRFRRPKRFMAVPSPLVAIEWWRICLDEAQMVESVTTKTAEMALRLSAVNRWCITGTPIQRTIEDLYGLLLFLGAEPYCVKVWWRECLYEPFCHGDVEPMHAVVSQFLWRTAKMDVLDQIGLPPQTEEMHWLRFTPVEEHFYRQQHIECSRDAVARFNTVTELDRKLSSLDRKTMSQLLAPLLRLRQSCCHPQAVRGQFISVHKSTLTMDELLTSLIKKTTTESEEAHRQHVAALNGIAGIHIIKEEWVEAAEKYRDVLRLADENADVIKTDKLQRLHALHNLSELLDAGHANIPPTLRDDNLREEGKVLRRDYLTRCANKVAAAQENLLTAQRAVAETENLIGQWDGCWWAQAISDLEVMDLGEELVDRVRTDLLAVLEPRKISLVNRFTDVRGLGYVITSELEALEVAHERLADAVTGMDVNPDENEVHVAVECHLRPTQKKPPKCLYCKIHELFNRYEAKLFSFCDWDDDRTAVEPDDSEEALLGQLRRGTWADSELEKMLKVIFNFARNQKIIPIEIDENATHIKLFELLKREFRALRGVWMQIRDQVSALDELNMATIRLRCRLTDEPKPDPPQPNILEPCEVNTHRLKLLSDQIVSLNEKKKKLGQLLYLKNLAKSDLAKGNGVNPEPCPICQKGLGEQWSVLQCGHCFCVECIRVLVSNCVVRGKCRSVKCPICRQTTVPGEISYVNTRGEETVEEVVQVLGSFSTKIEAIVRTLIQIKNKDPDAKALVFSTWTNVLDVLGRALNANNVTYRSVLTHIKFQRNINSFKKDKNVMVLLLPVQSGANGLNLIEATHVLLVEPILNPASELQAIDRIYRIGQNRPTTVHRFLVRNTIEERMHSMLKTDWVNESPVTASSHDSEENPLTIGHLRRLFIDEEQD